MIERLLATPNYIIGDIKIGEIPQYQIYDGTISHDGKVSYNPKKSAKALQTLLRDSVISQTEYDKLHNILGGGNITPQQHNALKKIDYHKIRWTPEDVLTGHRLLPSGRLFSIEDGLKQGLTKVDLLAYMDPVGYNEFSMIYLINHGNTWNVKMKKTDILNSIRSEIYEKLIDGNYFKASRRLFSLGNIIGFRGDDFNTLTELFNGDAGNLYLIYSDLQNLIYIVENQHLFNHRRVKSELDNFIERLAKVASIKGVYSRSVTNNIKKLVSLPLRENNITSFQQELAKLEKFFSKQLNDYTLKYMRDHNLFPIPSHYN